MSSLLLDCHDELERLFKLKYNNEIHRMGKLFDTNLNHYYYDTGTGKVLALDDDSCEIIHVLFDSNHIRSFDQWVQTGLVSIHAMNKFASTVINEHLFRAYKLDRLYTNRHYEGLEHQVNEGLEQVILELTGRCNLRCGYCIYNEDCDLNRNFNDDDMSFEIAKAAVDYTAQHSKEKVAVTFYGGEPLLKFDLLKWVIEYSLETMKEKELSFSLTTNLTLVTKEIAEYLAAVPNLSVVCSLDGPEYVQNSYRKYANGYGSFSKAFKGIKLMGNAFASSRNILSINAVFAPPYTYDKLHDINSFFASLDFLPLNTDINISYASKGSVPETEPVADKKTEGSSGVYNPMWNWMTAQSENQSSIRGDQNSIYASLIEKILVGIENRFISDEPIEFSPFNGCCVPGARRLYVSTTGELFVCERMGNSPSIGNIFDGIDFSNITRFYVHDYSKGSIEQCKNCWAVNLCSACYADNYTESGFNAEGKNRKCNSLRNSLVEDLVLYHSMRETAPEKLAFLKNAELV